MSNFCRAMSPLLLCAVIGACAHKPPPSPPRATPAPPPVVSSDVDGTYHGTSTRYQADSRACPSPGLVTLRMLNGLFSYRWNRDIFIDATLMPDGSVEGATGDITLRGHLNGRKIEGDVSNDRCAYHFTTTKR